ncbi:MAG: hypothetical protein JST30_07935 [Armatimonadetes bacterium]|nr:hypothetical protein [Armatimonadota bacterium]
MKRSLIGLCLAVGTASLFGCASPSNSTPEFDVRSGDGAPEFGSSEALKSYSGFVVGHWALTDYVDPEFAKQLGIGALSQQMADQPVSNVFDFASDGTFVYRRMKAEWKVAGKWAENGQGLTLTYESFNGKPLQQAQEESRKAAEGGTQAGVAQDLFMDQLTAEMQKLTVLRLASNKRMLVFTAPEGGQVQLAAGTALERLQQSATK